MCSVSINVLLSFKVGTLILQHVQQSVMLRLHYVPGGHGNHVSGQLGQNRMGVRQCWGTKWANVTGRDCHKCRAKFLNCQNLATVRMRNLVGGSGTGRMRQNVTVHEQKTLADPTKLEYREKLAKISRRTTCRANGAA